MLTTNLNKQILAEAKAQLLELQEEEKADAIKKEKRDLKIKKAKAVIELFSEDEVANEQGSLTIDSVVFPEGVKDAATAQFEYPIKGTWQERVKAILKFKNRVLTIAEMVAAFAPHEPKVTNKQLVGVVSNTVNGMVHIKNSLKKYDPPFKMKGLYYGNPLWWEGENLLEQYQPKPKEKEEW